MFEKFPKPTPRTQEQLTHPPQQEAVPHVSENESSSAEAERHMYERHTSAERALDSRVRETLLSASPEKLRSKAARTALAASILIGASSAYAEEREVSEQPVDDVVPTDSARFAFELHAAFTGQEASRGDFVPSISENQKIYLDGISNTLVYNDFSHSELYGEMSAYENRAFQKEVTELLLRAENSQDFLDTVSKNAESYTDAQKAVFLQYLGQALSSTYNFDMLEASEYVAVSNETMFSAMQEKVFDYESDAVSGICGNIHTYLMKAAQAAGMEAWLQNGAVGDSGHVWTGVTIGEGSEKQIVFVDYDALIPTGTLNYKDALGIAEQYHGGIQFMNTYVGTEDGAMLPVTSRGQDIMKEAAGVDEASIEVLARELSGESAEETPGLRISIEEQQKEIALTHNMIGLRAFTYTGGEQDPYQAVANADAVSGYAQAERWGFRGRIDAAVLNVTRKDLENGHIDTQQLVTEMTGSYVGDYTMTRSEYGTFTARFGAMVREVIAYSSQREDGTIGEGFREYAWGGRMVYLDPSKQHTFYIGAQQEMRISQMDYQEQEAAYAETERAFSIGGTVHAYEATVLGVEGGYAVRPYGAETSLAASVEHKDVSLSARHEQTDSDYQRFVPSSERTEVELEYAQPKWQVSVVGAKASEQYQDAETDDEFTAEVRLKINIW